MKARDVVGRGKEGPICDPGSELLLILGREHESSARKINGMKKKKMLQRYTKYMTTTHSIPTLFRELFVHSLGKNFVHPGRRYTKEYLRLFFLKIELRRKDGRN